MNTFDLYKRLLLESFADTKFLEKVCEAHDSQAVIKLLFDRVARVHDEAEALMQAADSFLRAMGR